MKIENTVTKSHPLVAHAQGHVHHSKKWIDIVDTYPLLDKSTIPGGITFISFFVLDGRMSLKEQLDASGVNYVNAANPELKYWKNTMKIKYLDECLSNITTPYVFCLDGGDILLSNDISDLINRFKTFDCKILYNASKLNYPLRCTDIEQTNTCFKYLNAGAFIGETNFIKKFYSHLMKTEMYKDYKGFNRSEQIRVREGRQTFPEKRQIKVDTECVIFQTLNQAEFKFENNSLIITK